MKSNDYKNANKIYSCARNDGWWYVPETDLIKPSVFRAELRWDENDTDVDLHVYDSFGNHAYYGDKDGVPGGRLDRDDTDGFGPETYIQSSDEGASYYDIYVKYYSDHGHGSTQASVKIYKEDAFGDEQLVGDYSRTLKSD